ncbi:unnamed protein product [Sphenostylis stenocarpa]|uniref:Uncharacterized protein n=1 Tax=Sphenostylis stenocarpa TaxID=92480 RepID=A0AA86VZ65_9FABA|nr:unnamed protein product [Sphenostylis stenocarpa]
MHPRDLKSWCTACSLPNRDRTNNFIPPLERQGQVIVGGTGQKGGSGGMEGEGNLYSGNFSTDLDIANGQNTWSNKGIIILSYVYNKIEEQRKMKDKTHTDTFPSYKGTMYNVMITYVDQTTGNEATDD